MTQTKYCPNQDPRQSVTSSYHLNQSALRGSTGYTREKNGYSFVKKAVVEVIIIIIITLFKSQWI